MAEQNVVQAAGIGANDYKKGLIIGLIIGLFLIPLEINLGLTAKYHLIAIEALIAFPIISVLGLFVANLLFSRVPVLWQFSKFGLVGVSNTVINFGVLNSFIYFAKITQGPWIFAFESIAFLGAVINSYFWNSHWSFQNKNPRTLEEFIIFTLITFIGLLLNSTILTFLSGMHPFWNISPKLWVNAAELIATLVVMFWDFAGFKFIVFKPKTV